MDLSLKDLVISKQDEDVPFIGDYFDPDTSETFVHPNKQISVKKLNFTGNILKIDVVVDMEHTRYVPSNFTHVIVGVRLLVPGDNRTTQETSAVWTFQFNKVREFSMGIEVTPGSVVVSSFLVMEISDFLAIPSVEISKLQIKNKLHNKLDLLMTKGAGLNDKLTPALDKDMKTYLKYITDLQNVLRSCVSNKLSDINCGNYIHSTLYIIKKFAWAQQRVNELDDRVKEIAETVEFRQRIIAFIRNKNCQYVSENAEFERLKHENKMTAMFIVMDSWPYKNKVIDSFLKLKEGEADSTFCFVDLDFIECNDVKPFVIQKFETGAKTVDNVEKMLRTTQKNLVKSYGPVKHLIPNKRGTLTLVCPGHGLLDCPDTKREWICEKCESQIYYGFDLFFYCICGAMEISNVKFRCERTKHKEYIPLDKKENGLDEIIPLESINIIVLGPTGVGKSTWINAFVNYMTYSTLDEAINGKVLAPIPCLFSVTNQDCKSIQVRCGEEDKDENLNIGQSVTLKCRQYSIVFDDKVFNLIDTPGLGDTRGIDEDRKNMKEILDFLQGFDNIHGICILLKPNEARVTLTLKYCLKEFLTNLHKSSSRNIVFCFTHARSTFYRAGETLPTLKKLLKDIDVDESCLSRSFYLDNEAFRFLCCLESNMTFSQAEGRCFSESWDRSASETRKLLNTVAEMVPHSTEESLSLNRARIIILNLIPIMIDLTQNIEQNVRLMEEHAMEIRDKEWNLKELKCKRYAYQIDLDRVKLDYPRTVCASERCVTYHILEHSGERKTEYSTHCHPHCYLSGNLPDEYPNPELRGCAAMAGRDHCQTCSCSWNVHMHIWYNQVQVEKPVIDQEIERKINSYTDSNALKADLLQSYQKRIKDLVHEKKKILEAAVKFACFLQANAIVAYNDSFLDYLQYKMRELTQLRIKSPLDERNISKLKELKSLYESEKDIFGKAVREEMSNIDPESISRCEYGLYELPINGAKLKNSIEMALTNYKKIPRDNVGKMVATKKKGVFEQIAQGVNNFFLRGSSQSQNFRGNQRGGNKRGKGKRNR